MSDLGDRLKAVRGKMSQDEMAKIMECHKNTLASYERGLRTPDVDYLLWMLEHFPDINPGWLLTGEGAMRRGVEGFEVQEVTPEYMAEKAGRLVKQRVLHAVEEVLTGLREEDYRAPAIAPVVDIKDAPRELMKQWVDAFWEEADEDTKAWFKIEFGRRWPEFVEWQKKQPAYSAVDNKSSANS